MNRYRILTVEGWLGAGVSSKAPGLSATVIDGLTGCSMRTFRSEDENQNSGTAAMRASALAKAKALCRELNAAEKAEAC